MHEQHIELRVSGLEIYEQSLKSEHIKQIAQQVQEMQDTFRELHDIVQSQDEKLPETETKIDNVQQMAMLSEQALKEARSYQTFGVIIVAGTVGAICGGPAAAVCLGIKSGAVMIGSMSAVGALVGVAFAQTFSAVSSRSQTL